MHLSVQIGPSEAEAVEVIYNTHFGDVGEPDVGSQVEACGDYITSTAPSGPYPASPDGAIVHWVHHSDRPGHESGFLMINGVLYGDSTDGANAQ
jgi:hypothetical protein